MIKWDKCQFNESDGIIISETHRKEYQNYYDSVSFKQDPMSTFSYSGCYSQYFQLSKVLRRMKRLEYCDNITFDIVMKLRFDINLPVDLVPYNFLSFDFPKILFPHSLKYFLKFSETFKEWENYEEWLSLQKINEENKSINRESGMFNFGGTFLYNFLIDKNLFKKRRIEMYNDYIIIGERDEMIRLIDFPLFVEDEKNVKKIIEMGKKLKIEKITAPESQLNIFLILNDIIPVMYFDDYGFIVRN